MYDASDRCKENKQPERTGTISWGGYLLTFGESWTYHGQYRKEIKWSTLALMFHTFKRWFGTTQMIFWWHFWTVLCCKKIRWIKTAFFLKHYKIFRILGNSGWIKSKLYHVQAVLNGSHKHSAVIYSKHGSDVRLIQTHICLLNTEPLW